MFKTFRLEFISIAGCLNSTAFVAWLILLDVFKWLMEMLKFLYFRGMHDSVVWLIAANNLSIGD